MPWPRGVNRALPWGLRLRQDGAMETQSPKPAPIIIGGGIVGLCIAWHLARRGLKPLVVEAGKEGAAYTGNAGAISHGSVAPLAMPGVLAQVPKMLMDPAGAHPGALLVARHALAAALCGFCPAREGGVRRSCTFRLAVFRTRSASRNSGCGRGE
jgi:glycine/D-amino acid oxidase-like deaminating enzyme